jgi:peptidoglycan hydrolase CwlO-like protein
MFQELIKIAEEVYTLDKSLGIRMGKCLEGLGKKVTEHNIESRAMNDKIKKLEQKIKALESDMRRRMH